MMFKQVRLTAGLFGVLALGAFSAQGASYLFPLGDVFTGSPPVSTTTPWVTALVEDVAPDTVRFTIENVNLTGSENLDEIYFNLEPLLLATDLVFTLNGTSGGFDLPTILTGTDQFKADGDGRYDILFRFSNAGMNVNRFNNTEWVSYTLTGIPGLVAQNFVHLSLPDGGNGPFFAAAHVQRIGPTGSDSGWISPHEVQLLVPEPTTAALCLAGGLIWFVGRRRG